MSAKSIDQKLAAKLATQKRLSDEIAQLKRDQAKRDRSERQKTERRIGRLALQYGLDQFSEDTLKALFQNAASELSKKGQNGRHPRARSDSDDEHRNMAANSTP